MPSLLEIFPGNVIRSHVSHNESHFEVMTLRRRVMDDEVMESRFYYFNSLLDASNILRKKALREVAIATSELGLSLTFATIGLAASSGRLPEVGLAGGLILTGIGVTGVALSPNFKHRADMANSALNAVRRETT